MKIENNFIYRLTDRLGTLAVIPLGEKGFSIDYERKNDAELSYEKKLSGKIVFVGEAYSRLLNMENSIYRCEEQTLTVVKKCNDIEKVVFSGNISLNQAEFNLDKCQIITKILDDKTNKCLEEGKGKKINVFESLNTRVKVKTKSFQGEIQTQNCNHSSTSSISPDYWCGTGDPYLQNWTLVSYNEHSPDGTHYFVNNVWKREIIEIGCSESIDPEWVLVEDNCGTTGKKKFAKTVTLYGCEITSTPEDENGSYQFSKDCKVLGYDGGTTEIDNGVHLTDVLTELVKKSCPNLTVKSDFFQINSKSGKNILLNSNNITLNGNDYNNSDNSVKGKIIVGNSNGSWNGYSWILLSENLNIGDVVTFSIDFKSSINCNIQCSLIAYYVENHFTKTETLIANQWKRISLTGTVISTNANGHLIGFSGSNMANAILEYKNEKIEFGNIATPFSPSNTSLNYVTGKVTNTNNIVIFQKSDIKRPNATNNALKLEIDLETMLETLKTMFNVKWRIEGNIFRLEHVSYYSKAVGTNVMSNELKKYFEGKRIYSYESEKIPQKERFKFKEQQGEDWKMEIDYTGCVTNTTKNEVDYIVEEAMTDMVYAMQNPSADNKYVEDAGYVLVSAKKISGEYYINSEPSPNGTRLNNVFAWVQLVRDYHYYERPMKVGKVNGVTTNFITSIPTKKGEKFAIPLNICKKEFNPDEYVLTSLGQGIVASGKYRFNDNFLELDLLYESNQNLVSNLPPSISGGGLYYTYKDVPKTINITTNDADGTVSSVLVNSQPNNGIVQINSISQITYIPNSGFVGNDYFSLKAIDNYSEVSNVENFSIQVKPTNQAPIANNDTFTVYQNESFAQGTSLFSNDSDDNSFSIVNSTITTSQGVTITINELGFFSYVPPTGFEGVDTFQYSIKDNANLISTATVSINVIKRNKPIAVLDEYQTKINTTLTTDGTFGKKKLTENDYTPDGLTYVYTTTAENKYTSQNGTVQIMSDGNFVYTPPNNFTGIDEFSYTVHNVNGSGNGSAKITVVPNVYVRLVTNDNKTNGHYGDPLRTKTKDYFINFFSDISGTIPLDVSGLGIKILINELHNIINNNSSNSYNLNWETSVLSGTSHKILDDYVYQSIEEDQTEGIYREENITLSLLAGSSYIII